MCVQHVPSPVEAAEVKVQSTYTGPLDDQLAEAMTTCDAEVHVSSPIGTHLHPIFLSPGATDVPSDQALSYTRCCRLSCIWAGH